MGVAKDKLVLRPYKWLGCELALALFTTCSFFFMQITSSLVSIFLCTAEWRFQQPEGHRHGHTSSGQAVSHLHWLCNTPVPAGSWHWFVCCPLGLWRLLSAAQKGCCGGSWTTAILCSNCSCSHGTNPNISTMQSCLAAPGLLFSFNMHLVFEQKVILPFQRACGEKQKKPQITKFH